MSEPMTKIGSNLLKLQDNNQSEMTFRKEVIFQFWLMPSMSCFLILIAIFIGCAPRLVVKKKSAVIVGASMAPQVIGKHARAKCHACKYSFIAGCLDDPTNPLSISDLRQRMLVCPNCGLASDNHSLQLADAQNVGIQLEQQVARWSLVAIQTKMEGRPVYGVKRLVGLPNESILFSQGNLFLVESESSRSDSKSILRKPLEVQRKMMLPVNDSQFSDGVDRWKSDSSVWDQNHEPMLRFDWRTYIPRRCFVNLKSEPAIEDGYSCNPTDNRELNRMDEIFLRLEFESRPAKDLAFQINLRGEVVTLCFRWEKNEIEMFQSSKLLPAKLWNLNWDGDTDAASNRFIVEFSSIDFQIVASIDGKQVWSQPIEPQDGVVLARPIRFGFDSTDADDTSASQPTRVQLFRDVYYLPAPLKVGDNGRFQPSILDAENGYILLGDNVPVSTDSRYWTPAKIETHDVIGTVLTDP